VRRRFAAVLLGLAAGLGGAALATAQAPATPPSAQTPDEATRLEPVVVTVTRMSAAT